MAKKSLDYTDFYEAGNKPPKSKNDDHRWWLQQVEEIPDSIYTTLSLLRNNQTALVAQRQVSRRLYGNQSIFGYWGLQASRIGANTTAAARSRIRYNVIQSVVDTITAKIAKNRPRPMFLTSGGDYRQRRRAQKLTKFCEGIFSENQVERLGPEIFRDACIYGTGIVHVFEANGRIRFERVIPDEIWVDEVEAFAGQPRQLHRVKLVDRDSLCELFPEKKDEILNAKAATTDDLAVGPHSTIGDMLAVVESWHLPSGPDAKDGLHVITLSETLLFKEAWEHDTFPFAFFHWNKRLDGFWGQGLAEQIESIQLEINKLLWVIQRSMQLAGSFRIAVEQGSQVPSSHLNDELGSIIFYKNVPPQYLVPPIVQPEIYQHLQTLRSAAYEQAGISMLSAAAKKPDGLDSGKALREYNDIESDRFQTVGQAYENFHLDLARLAIVTARAIYDANGSFSVKAPGRKFIESIDWDDVSMEDDEYVLQLFPVSNLPNTPAGRLETVKELIQAGFLSPRQGNRLLNFPDLEQIESLQDAVEERIHDYLEKIIDEGDYTSPDAFMDLSLAKELCLEYINLYSCQNIEDDKLNLLQTFYSQCDELIAKAQAQQASIPPANQPQAAPQAQPTSPLVPNVPAGQSAA